jgi:hypothetical protein
MRGRGEKEGQTYPTELTLPERQKYQPLALTSHTRSPGPRVWGSWGVIVSCERAYDAPHHIRIVGVAQTTQWVMLVHD